jgi:hypothetical protein
MTLTKLINDRRLSTFVVVVGALVATTLWAAELADQPRPSFLSVAAFIWTVYLACRLFEWCDGDDAHANHAGAIAARRRFAGIGITIVRSVRSAAQNGTLCAVANRARQAQMRSSNPGRSGLPGCSSRGGHGNRYLPRGASGPVDPTDAPDALQLVPRNTLRILVESAVLATWRLPHRGGVMKRRHEFYLDAEVSERLATMTAKPGSSKTSIMTDALKAYFDRAASTELDERFRARLDKLSIQLGRLERDQQIVAEALALLARFQFLVTAPLTASDHAARSLAQERFKAFIDQVSRRISGGRGLIEQVLALTSAGDTNARNV